MDIRNKKLSDDEFYGIRKEIMGQWPTGKEVNFDEAVAYHKAMPESKSFSQKLAKAKKERKTLIQPRAGVALIDEHIKLLQYLQDKGEADLLPTTIDSYTRQNRYEEAEVGIKESIRTQKSMLNGFPAVNHGVYGCRSIIENLDTPCNVLNQLLQGMNTGSLDMELLPQVQQAAGEIISFLQVTPPFSRLNRSYFEQKLAAIFSEEYMEDAKAYLQFTQQEQLICALTGQHSKATMLVRIAQVLGHLSYSLGQYKEALTKFAEQLNEPGYDRTPDGYAAMFGQFFKGEPTLSVDNPAWMTLTNASVQYVAATRPGKTEPQLVKRMHYVSFVGMFRSDLFEGLCVGHAPKKCPICGRWFLTIDARHTKYCGGLAPGDQRGRTCRQIGNLRGREQRELADDHPIKAIYTRRMNTILQSTRRGRLDEETAAAMKKLAKDKMLRALSDQRYASTVYEQEMTQDALLKAVQKK